jgi:hypothetical protein
MICIPTTFRLGGRKWQVVLCPLIDNDADVLGLTDTDEAVIYLQEGLKKDVLNHTFYHELEHAIRATLGIEDEEDTHGQVDARGGILMQYLDSKRGRLSVVCTPSESS